MYYKEIYKKIGQELSKEEGCAIVQGASEKVLLNISASIVWGFIDGYSTVESILERVQTLYGDYNSAENITEVVEESISVLLKHNLIESAG